ncbi:MAG: hypothetical protein JW774_10645 [Candidatus Aureabacteria bacterium]|nr:hypothetical protein [Candidatus Auribacterota bacterium]
MNILLKRRDNPIPILYFKAMVSISKILLKKVEIFNNALGKNKNSIPERKAIPEQTNTA